MAKRNIIGISALVLLLVALIFGYFYMKAPALTADKAIPDDVALFVEFSDFQSVYEDVFIEGNQVWKSISKVEPLDIIDTSMLAMARVFYNDVALQDMFTRHPVFLSVSPGTDNKYSILLALELPGAHYGSDVQKAIKKYLGNSAIKSVLQLGDTKAYELSVGLEEKQLFFAVKNGLFLASADAVLLEKSIIHLDKNMSVFGLADIKKVKHAAGQKVMANVFVRYTELGKWAQNIFNKKNEFLPDVLAHFAASSELDLTLKENKCYLNGFTYATENQSLKCFAQGGASYSKAGDVLPVQSGCFYQYALNEQQDLPEIIRKRDSLNDGSFDGFLRLIRQEIIVAQVIDETFLLVGTDDAEHAVDVLAQLLPSMEKKQEYRGLPVYKFSFDKTVQYLPALKSFKPEYLTIYDDYLVFAENSQSVKAYIKNLSDGQTLNKSPEFLRLSEDLSWQSDITFWCSFKASLKTFEQFLSEPLYQWMLGAYEDLQKLNGFAIQFTDSGDGLVYTSVVVQYYNAGKVEEQLMYEVFREEETEEEEPEIIPSSSAESQSFSGKPGSDQSDWTIALEGDLIGQPHFIYDHRAREQKIIAFDDQKKMYLVSPNGRIIWSINLRELPVSDVYEVDYYKNGKIQYLFNSPNYLYLIDLEGRNVANYPIHLPVEASNPIAVFDYNKTLDYRIFWTGTNNKAYCFDKQGKPKPGWRINTLDHKVSQPLQSLSKGNSAYIVIPMDNGNVYLTSRTGVLRMRIEKSFDNALGSDFYINQTNSKGLLLTTDIKGSVIYIPASGPIKRTRFGDFSPEHFFLYEDFTGNGAKDFIYLDKNRLVVFDRFRKKILEHIFSSSPNAKPEIFTTSKGRKILGVVCPDEYRIYLFDKDGLIEGKKFRGRTPFCCGKIRNSANAPYVLVSGAGENLIYQVLQ